MPAKKYYEANKEQYKAYNKKWYEDNKEHCKEMVKKCKEKNKETYEAKRRQPYTCLCGTIVQRRNKKRHQDNCKKCIDIVDLQM
jgi:hypothetical protein